MGESLITRRGGGSKGLTFDGTPVLYENSRNISTPTSLKSVSFSGKGFLISVCVHGSSSSGSAFRVSIDGKTGTFSNYSHTSCGVFIKFNSSMTVYFNTTAFWVTLMVGDDDISKCTPYIKSYGITSNSDTPTLEKTVTGSGWITYVSSIYANGNSTNTYYPSSSESALKIDNAYVIGSDTTVSVISLPVCLLRYNSSINIYQGTSVIYQEDE